MKRSMAIALAVAGSLAAQAPAAFAAGGFAGGGGGASGGHGGSNGGSRAGGSSMSRSGSFSRGATASSRATSRSSFARAHTSGFRFASNAGVRNGDPFRFFSPNSVVPLSRCGFFPNGFNGSCFTWNGQRCFFPWRCGSRFFGNGLVAFGGDWWPSDDDTIHHHRDDQYQPPYQPSYQPIMVPVPVASAPSAATPTIEVAPAANVPPVSREFAYGSMVSEVQNRLAREGYFRGSVDGYLTPGTRTAIAMYQDRHQLVITGRIDAALLQAMALKPQSDS